MFMYLQSNRPSTAHDVTHWQQKNYSCFFSYHTMVARTREHACLTLFDRGKFSEEKASATEMEGQTLSVHFFSVATVIFSQTVGESSLLHS